MERDRRNRISELHHAALVRPAGERAAFLRAACDGDEVLLQEIESLLAHESASSGFLETPAAAVVAGAPTGMPMLNRQIGPYTIVAPLGVGGMGEVYRARDTKLGRDVAIKILPRVFTSDPEPEMFPPSVKLSERLNARTPLSTMSPEMNPVVPPLPICSAADAAIVVPPV